MSRVIFPMVLVLAVTTGAAFGDTLIDTSGLTWQTMTVDENLYEGDGPLPVTLGGSLDAQVRMAVDSGWLFVELQNTTINSSAGAFNVLTSVGFDGSSLAGPVAGNLADNNVSSYAPYWGFGDNHGGYFDAPPVGDGPATLSYTTVLSTMAAAADGMAINGDILAPDALDGPDYGVGSTSASGGGIANLATDTLWFQLKLKDGVDANTLLNTIESGNIGVSFGSPTVSDVPEPTSLVALASLGLSGIGLGVWKRRKR